MIIGISGQAGVGKDTFADALGFTKVALADPMKRFCAMVYGFTEDELWGPSEMRNRPRADLDGLTARHALQTLGTEWGRACHPDTWIRLAIKTSLALLRPTNGGERPLRYSAPLGAFRGEVHEPSVRGVVIPDIRFGNELAAIRAAGGKVIRITRPAAGLHGAAGVHASEAEQRDVPDTAFDAVIRNTGTVDDLRRQALALIGGA